MKFITLIFILTLISGCSQSLDNNAFTPKPEELLKDPAYKKKILDIDDLRTEQELEKFSDLIEQSRITREDNGTEPIVVEVERIRPKEGEVLLDENGEELIDPLHDKVQVEEYYIVDGAIIDFDSATEQTPELNKNEEEAPEAPTEEVEEVKTEVDNDAEISETEAEAAPVPPSVNSLAPKTSLRPKARKIIEVEKIEEPKIEAKIPEGIMAENTVIEESTPPVTSKKSGETIPSAEENENPVIKATLNLTQTPQQSSPISKTLVEEGQELGIFIDDNDNEIEHEEVRSQPKQEAIALETVEPEKVEPNSSRLAVEKSLRPKKRPENLKSKLAVKESLRPKARPNRESVGPSNSNNDLEVKAVFSGELAPESETESTSNIMMLADWDERKDGPEFTKLTVEALEKYGENLLNPDLKMNRGGYSRYCKQYNILNRKKRTQFWLMFISGLSRMESGFRTDTKFKEDFTDAHGTIYSRGLLQMSIRSVNQKAYSCNVERAQDLHKPEVNLNCAVRIMNFWVKKDMAIYGVKTTKKSKRDWQGVANYWSPIRLEKYRGSKRKKHERLGEMINQMDICR